MDVSGDCPARRIISILSKTAGARDKRKFFNGLIQCLHRRVKTGFRLASLPAAPGLFGSNLDTPRHLVREGRLFNVVVPDVSCGLVSRGQVLGGTMGATRRSRL